MNSSSVRRLLTAVVAVGTATATVLAATPATAGQMGFSKSSGTVASVSWLEVGEIPGVDGNAHFGDLWVEDMGKGRAFAWGVVYDVQCEDGVEPYMPGWGHHGEDEGEPEEPVEEACVFVGERYLDGGPMAFTIDKKLTQARLTGTLSVWSGHGDATGSPRVDITWTGVGSRYTSRESYSYSDEWGTYRMRYTFSGRDAVIGEGSYIGGMIFDDEDGEWSDAQLGTYRSMDRWRS